VARGPPQVLRRVVCRRACSRTGRDRAARRARAAVSLGGSAGIRPCLLRRAVRRQPMAFAQGALLTGTASGNRPEADRSSGPFNFDGFGAETRNADTITPWAWVRTRIGGLRARRLRPADAASGCRWPPGSPRAPGSSRVDRVFCRNTLQSRLRSLRNRTHVIVLMRVF